MKILSNSQIKAVDQKTIETEPISSINLMERAGKACFDWMDNNFQLQSTPLYVFCGPGNNGGDGLVLARLLASKKIKVSVFGLSSNRYSPEYKHHASRLMEYKIPIQNCADFKPESIPKNAIMVDALFGSGLNAVLEGEAAEISKKINQTNCLTISIDIPSGMFSNPEETAKQMPIVQANYTLCLQIPKLSFFLKETHPYVGELIILNIGLSSKAIEEEQSNFYLLNHNTIASWLIPRTRFSHKGTYGHSLLIGGSYGKMGSIALSAKASLKSGVGLCTVQTPKIGVNIIQTLSPEAMVVPDDGEFFIESIPKHLQLFSAIGIGPGMGKTQESQKVLKHLIGESIGNIILDADALNILAENKTWISFLKKNTILSPHPKEFERLFGKTNDHWERIQLQVNMSIKHGVIIVLKDAITSISSPAGNLYFNTIGNPGMATAGSGDVLTGIITGLLAQHYAPLKAVLIGVYLHALAGDLAKSTEGEEALLASDIITHMGKAFNFLKNNP